MKGPIWRGGKLTTAATWRPIRVSGRIVFGDLGGGFLDADLRAEIDLQLEGGLARFREGLDVDDGADADIDFQKIVEGDRHGLTRQFARAFGGGGDGLVEQRLHAVFGHQHLQGRIGRALGRGDVLARASRRGWPDRRINSPDPATVARASCMARSAGSPTFSPAAARHSVR